MNKNLNDHYGMLLGLETPWEVTSVNLELENKRVEVALEHQKGPRVKCPDCDESCTIYDHAPERQWRHLDTMQFETVIKARLPRSQCSECGVKSVVPPWAGKHSRFTLMFEAFAIEVLGFCSSVEAACALLGIDWGTADTLMKRAVERGLARRDDSESIQYLGIDEKSFRSGHRYVSLLNNLKEGTVIEVVEGRDESSAAVLFESLTEDQLKGVDAVALDMWKAFMNAAGKACPNADLVHDKFHVSKYLGDAVNAVRRAETKQLTAEGDKSLTGTRWWWNRNEENISDAIWESFEELKNSELKTARAWAIKEYFRWFWEPHLTREDAEEYFYEHWYSWAIRSRLEPIKRGARMLKITLKGSSTGAITTSPTR